MRNFTIVAIDETLDWNDRALVEQAGGTLYTLYAFDSEEVTFLCETSPSYHVVPFDIVPSLYPENAKEWELMYDALQDGLNDGTDATYVRCSVIDGLGDEYKHTEPFDEGETLDDALEHFRGNSTAPEVCRSGRR
jgi:hypothetical protein